MIIKIIIAVIVGIPLLLGIIGCLNLLWLSLVDLWRFVTGSSKPHGYKCDLPDAVKRALGRD